MLMRDKGEAKQPKAKLEVVKRSLNSLRVESELLAFLKLDQKVFKR